MKRDLVYGSRVLEKRVLDYMLGARSEENTKRERRVLDTGNEDAQKSRDELRSMVRAFVNRIHDEEDCRMFAVDLADGPFDKVRALVLHLLMFAALQVLSSSDDDRFPKSVLGVGELIREGGEEQPSRGQLRDPTNKEERGTIGTTVVEAAGKL